jgi:hypothetical protein
MLDVNRMHQTRTRRIRGDYVLLRADSLHLLVPQRDVLLTEYREQMPQATSGAGIFTMADASGTEQPVAALSSQMTLLEQFPEDRLLLTRFAGAGRRAALAWSEVRVLIDTELELHALPDIMRNDAGPIEAYVELDRELAFCTTAQRLFPGALAESD